MSPETSVEASEAVARYRHRLWATLQVAEDATASGTKTLYPELMALENLLMSDFLTDDEQDALLADPEFLNFASRSRKLFIDLELDIEKNLTLLFRSPETCDLLLNRPSNVMHNYLTRFEILVANEIRLAAIAPGARILMIGSGYFPTTAVELVKQVDGFVDCVDFADEPVAVSREVIRRMGLENRIAVIHGRGEEQDVAPYDAVLVGCLAQPKSSILANLARTASAQCAIVCRTTSGARSLMWKHAGAADFNPYHAVRSCRARGTQHLSSMLVQL